MLVDFTVDCNEYFEKILNNYSIFPYRCPKCGAKHAFTRHGVYDRNICRLNNNFQIIENKMAILRLYCTSCESTHAILPRDIVPYCIYTFSCIFQILVQHFIENESILELCKKLKISWQLIYSFISRYLRFINSAVLVLRSLGCRDADTSTLIADIIKYSKSHTFQLQYFVHTKWIFLMTKFHDNLSPPILIGMHFEPPT